jgi:hypothetical protein
MIINFLNIIPEGIMKRIFLLFIIVVIISILGSCRKKPTEPGSNIGVPTLIDPTGGEQVTAPVSFYWSAVQGANGYTIQVDTNRRINSPIVSAQINETTFTFVSVPLQICYWRVAARNDDGSNGEFSSIDSFNCILTDSQEISDADFLMDAFSSMIGDLGTYDDYVGVSSLLRDPPPGWFGPDTFTTPDGSTSEWYWFELGMPEDTLLTLLMLNPDSWADTNVTWVNSVEVWLWYQIENTVWYNFELTIASDTTSIDGYWKWNDESTWIEYNFIDMSVVYGDYSATINGTTSSNLNISAHYDLVMDGSGSGWGNYQTEKFADFTFYIIPANPYRGHYTILSEGWAVQHYF